MLRETPIASRVITQTTVTRVITETGLIKEETSRVAGTPSETIDSIKGTPRGVNLQGNANAANALAAGRNGTNGNAPEPAIGPQKGDGHDTDQSRVRQIHSFVQAA
jgi:hypothetical protein